MLRHRVIAVIAGAATAVLVAGCAVAATSSSGSGQEKLAAASESKSVSRKTAAAGPLHVVSMTPGKWARDVNGGAPITVTFSSALAPSTPLPTLSPAIAGSWKVSGAKVMFTPSAGYQPGTAVTLRVPGGRGGMTGAGASAGALKKTSSVTFTTGTYSLLRLQQLLAQLGYLPLTWTPSDPATAAVAAGSSNAQVFAAYHAPAGTLTVKSGYPKALTSQWKTGSDNILLTGAVRAFEYAQGLTMDGTAGPEVWSRLLTAVGNGTTNPNGYTYALTDQSSPHETLRVWHNGKIILDTPANTGIAASNTQDGTFPVYLRYPFQYMKGTNPDGSKYNDPVSWISYFNAGDAVHSFPRASYGSYQSLGCVELPGGPAKFIWPYLTYGTLVTVQGPAA